MTLRWAQNCSDEEGMQMALENDANGRSYGMGGISAYLPLEAVGIDKLMYDSRTIVEALGRKIVARRIATLPVRIVVDNLFLGIGLQEVRAQCVIDLFLCII